MMVERRFFYQPFTNGLLRILRSICGRVELTMLALAVLVVCTIIPFTASALNTDGMVFSTFWPCAGNNSACGTTILAEGLIESKTDQNFATFLSENRGRNYLPDKPTICFNSIGGDLVGAIKLGRMIRKLGFDTCLAPVYERVIPNTGGDQEVFVRNVVCVSACTFALIGGENRIIESGSRYGIHQFYGSRGNIGDSATQVTLVALALYLEEMGVSRNLLDRASLVPPAEVLWLSSKELLALKIDNMALMKAQWQLSVTEDGIVAATIAQIKPGPQSRISLTVTKEFGQVLLGIGFVPGRRYPRFLDSAIEALNEQRQIILQIDNQQVATYDSVGWDRRRDRLVTILPISSKVIQSLQSGKVLNLKVQVPHASEYYDPSIQFPLVGLNTLLKAVLK